MYNIIYYYTLCIIYILLYIMHNIYIIYIYNLSYLYYDASNLLIHLLSIIRVPKYTYNMI